MPKKIAGITLEEVKNKALWVARFTSGYREVGIYSEIVKYYLDREDCKDIDLLCYDRQPEELKPFFDKMDQLTKSNGWMTLSELFEKFGNVQN